MSISLCFDIRIIEDEAGRLTMTGFFYDKDGTEYASEDGIAISDESAEFLRKMELDSLPAKKKKLNLGFQVADGGSEMLILKYKNGKEKQKEISKDIIDTILEEAIKEFGRNSLAEEEKS